MVCELYFSLTSRGRYRLSCRQVEAVVNVGGQQIVTTMMVLVSLQVLMDLVYQQGHGFKGSSAKIYCIWRKERKWITQGNTKIFVNKKKR